MPITTPHKPTPPECGSGAACGLNRIRIPHLGVVPLRCGVEPHLRSAFECGSAPTWRGWGAVNAVQTAFAFNALRVRFRTPGLNPVHLQWSSGVVPQIRSKPHSNPICLQSSMQFGCGSSNSVQSSKFKPHLPSMLPGWVWVREFSF